MNFLLKQLFFGQLQSYFVRSLTMNLRDENRQAKPVASEITVSLTSATLSLLDEIKRRAMDASRSATIERLILKQVQNDDNLHASRSTDNLSETRESVQPVASATYFYQKDDTSQPLYVALSRVGSAFRLTLKDNDDEFNNLSFSFAKLSEMPCVLDGAKDPRISSREARLLLELFSERVGLV